MTTDSNVVDIQTLLQALKPHRTKNHCIVTTNGCFDVLHVGHLRYLQQAKQAGDVLVLLLNSDASIRRLKGAKRPIVPQDERAELLAGLRCVDYVCLFDEDTPIALLEQIKPTRHVKGAQYTEDTLPEAAVLKAMGTELVFVPMVDGKSTTNLIERIIASHSASSASCNT